MRLPRTVLICGKTWKVKKDSSVHCGGHFNGTQQEIVVGSNQSDEGVFEVFLHEVCEAVLTERMHRYGLPYEGFENGNQMFVFNHAQFENVVKDIAMALRKLIK